MNMQSFEKANSGSFEDALESAIMCLEEQGIGQSQNDPPVTIVITTNGQYIGNQKQTDTVVYVDGTKEEIANHLSNLVVT